MSFVLTAPRSPASDLATQAKRTPSYSSHAHIEDPDWCKYEDCEESAYSGAMGTIIKDMHRISKGSQHPVSRVLRISLALSLAISLVVMQLFVLYTIKTFVTSPAVRSIRGVYDEYEKTMYNGHVRETGYGFSVGIGGPTGPFFDQTAFDRLSGGLKSSVCIIPFSQPAYLSIILFIWTLSVVGELRMVVSLSHWLYMIEKVDIGKAIEDHDGKHIIVGLPGWLKALTFSVVLLPRLLTSALLLWLGCRWLAATLDNIEVLINSIALEFVIRLNSLLYAQLVSDRSKRELKNLKLDMRHINGEPPSAFTYIGASGWMVLSVFFIYLYLVHMQMVLPGYQWDVRKPCAAWVKERFDFWRI